MEIAVALDGSKRRDLSFYPGDDLVLNLKAYAKDGDSEPIEVINSKFIHGYVLGPELGAEFTVPEESGREPYKITGDVSGQTTTLAFGWLMAGQGYPEVFCWSGRGWFGCDRWLDVWGTAAENIQVKDVGQYYMSQDVEGVLQEVGARQRQFQDDLDSLEFDGSDQIGYRQFGNSAVSRTVESKLREQVSAADYGIDSTGIENVTSLFNSLEQDIKGKDFDLQSGTYLVDQIPNGNNYFNGCWKISTQLYYLEKSPKNHPLDSPNFSAKSILAAEGVYRGLSTAAFARSGSPWVNFVYREALGHAPENGTPIFATRTDDLGDSCTPPRIIAQQDNADIRNWASGMMGNGRAGILAARRDISGGVYLNSLFIYSDDDGLSFNQVNVPITSNSWDSHSRIYPFPASVGGHDTLGWIAYAYTTSDGICSMRTVNNGASWTEAKRLILPSTLDPNSEASNLSEMSVARIGNQNKWLMVIRTNQQAAVSVSTDMQNWSPAKLVSSGMLAQMLANPPELIYENGKLWLWTFSRRGSKEIYPENANALMVAEGDPDTLFSSGGISGWKQWRQISNLPFWPSGYMNFFTVRNKRYALCTTGEDTAGGSTSRQCIITLLGDELVVTTPIKNTMQLIPKVNLYPIGDFRYLPLPGPFSASSSRVTIAPLTSFGRNGGVLGATISRLTGSKNKYKLRISRNDGDSSLAAINTIIVFPLDDSYPLRNRFITFSAVISAGSGFSAANMFLNIRARSTSSTAEGVVSSLSGSFPVGDTLVQSSNTGINIDSLVQKREITIGPFPSDCNQAMLQIFWTPVGTALNDFVDIEAIKIEEGKIATPFEKQSYPDLIQWSDRFMRVFNMPTINGRQFRPLNPRMYRTPTTEITVGTLVASTQDYITVDDTGNNLSTVTVTAKM